MTGKGQPCWTPKAAVQEKGTLWSHGKELGSVLPWHHNHPVRVWPYPDPLALPAHDIISQLALPQPPLLEGPPCYGHQALCHQRGLEESGVSHFPLPALKDKKPQREEPGRTERFGVGRGEVWPIHRLPVLHPTSGADTRQDTLQERGARPLLKAMGPPLARG